MHFNPCVVVLTGPPLHGKTTVGQKLAEKTNLQPHDVDRIKADILVAAAKKRGEEHEFSKGTPPEVMAGMYQVLVDYGRTSLAYERPVLLTGTFSKPEFKAPLVAWLDEQRRVAAVPDYPALPFRIFRLNVTSFDVIAERIEKRQAEGHPSSITSQAKYEKSLGLVSPWPDWVQVIDIDASRPLDVVVADVREHIVGLASFVG